MLAQVLLLQGRVDEAERFALEARATVGAADVSSGSTTLLALGLVRAAQGRDEEAEGLLRESDGILEPTGFRRHQIAPRAALPRSCVSAVATTRRSASSGASPS